MGAALETRPVERQWMLALDLQTAEKWLLFFWLCLKKRFSLDYIQQLPPDSATSAIATPCSLAMNPSTEKMANPATKLVRLFNRHRAMESLPGQVRSLVMLWFTSWYLQSGHCSSETIQTCSSCCCTCCSFPTMWGRQYKLHMSRKSGCQHPSTPEGKIVFGVSLSKWWWDSRLWWLLLSVVALCDGIWRWPYSKQCYLGSWLYAGIRSPIIYSKAGFRGQFGVWWKSRYAVYLIHSRSCLLEAWRNHYVRLLPLGPH